MVKTFGHIAGAVDASVKYPLYLYDASVRSFRFLSQLVYLIITAREIAGLKIMIQKRIYLNAI